MIKNILLMPSGSTKNAGASYEEVVGMIGKKNVGDKVLAIGNVVDLDWISYIDDEIDPKESMDNMIGKITEIVAINDDFNDDRLTYKLDGCQWWWAPEWLAEVNDNQIIGQISIEDFGLVVS